MFEGVLNNLGSDFILLGLLFVIFFALINLALSKSMKDKRTGSIIAVCVSLLIVYGISKANWDISRTVGNIGIGNNIIYTVLPLIIIAGLIFMVIKLKIALSLILVGTVLVILSFSDYKKGTLMAIGIIFIIAGIIIWITSKKKQGIPSTSSLSGASNNSNKAGKKALVDAAKKFRKWALSQPNPKFVGGWTYFVNYLKKGGWGNSEADICARLGISANDFRKIFRKHGLVK